MTDSVEYEVCGQNAWIRLNRPEALNAINGDMRDKMEALLTTVEGDPKLRSLVITGSGKAFCAGSDIGELKAMDSSSSITLSQRIADIHRRLARLSIPVVAAINGLCVGGGLELALACDIRLAANHAKFGFPEPRLGLMTGGGGLPRLAHLIGSGPARQMALTGEIISANQAFTLGIIGRLIDPDDFLPEIRKFTEVFALLSPSALSQIKTAMIAIENGSLTAAIDAEVRTCAACFESADLEEGLSAFIEKRPPSY